MGGSRLMEQLLLVALVAGAASGVLLAVGASRFWRRLQLRRRFGRGRRAEVQAADLLAAAGYRLVGEQVPASYELRVAGRPAVISVRADLLAERRGRCYVVEVKTGQAADPLSRDTRRQLLEYRHAYPEADGLLLADMDRRRLYPVDFGAPGRSALRRLAVGIALLALGSAAGALVTTLLAGR